MQRSAKVLQSPGSSTDLYRKSLPNWRHFLCHFTFTAGPLENRLLREGHIIQAFVFSKTSNRLISLTLKVPNNIWRWSVCQPTVFLVFLPRHTFNPPVGIFRNPSLRLYNITQCGVHQACFKWKISRGWMEREQGWSLFALGRAWFRAGDS